MEFKTESGSNIVVRPASFQDAMALRKAILAEMKEVDTSIDLDVKKIDAATIMEKLPNLVFAVDASDRVEKALFECLKQCTRNGEKVAAHTFDDADAREDYYPIAIACMKVNLSPFLKGLVSAFGSLNLET